MTATATITRYVHPERWHLIEPCASLERDLHLDPIGGSPAQTAAFFKEESTRWGKVIRTANIKAD